MLSHPLLAVVENAAPGRSGCVCHVEEFAARAGEMADWPGWADEAVVAGYGARGIARPWRHQLEACEAIHASRHTVIATSTGSGKSLAFWLPVLSDIRRSGRQKGRISQHTRRPSAIYVAPTKALAADQLDALGRVLQASGAKDVRAGTADGDASFAEKKWAQDYADIVLTNPDFLHFSMLPRHERWARLFRGLSYVIVDECHAYRGVFGAHVALVMRRIRRLAAYYGAEPVFVLASATTADPAVSAGRLIGVASEEIACVTRDTAPSGKKTVVLWKPPDMLAPLADVPLPQVAGAAPSQWETPNLAPRELLPQLGSPAQENDTAEAKDDDPNELPGESIRRSASAECANLLADLTTASAHTLAFVRSRFAAESVADQTRRSLAMFHDASLAKRVATYRGGYLPEERRDLEKQLREGRLLGLVSTNALELGIDISGLDAVLIAGWPGTRASLWQQIGRAGRAGKDGLAIWIAGTNPLDSYVVDHPEAVFGAQVEATVFDPANPYVLAPHLCAAAAELPITRADSSLFGPDMLTILAQLELTGVIRQRPTGWYWTRPEPASNLTDLRGGEAGIVQVVEESTGRVLGTVDSGSAEHLVHTGAVYIHQGESFLVRELDTEAKVAFVYRSEPRYRTIADDVISVGIVKTREKAESAPGSAPSPAWSFGEVNVRTQVTGFDRVRVPGISYIDTQKLDLPEHTFATTATWLSVSTDFLARAGLKKADIPGALHAAEHAMIALLPLLATCDRWDLGGLSTAWHPDTELATIFVYDAMAGGAGFAQRGFAERERWLAATRDLIASCPCEDGCPACVQSPKCGNANSMLNKKAAAVLLKALAPLG